MSTFIKDLVKRKIKQLSYEDLLYYGEQYGFSLTQTEAKNITIYIKTNTIDPFNENDRKKMFQDLAEITNTDTAEKAQRLFSEIISSYGLDHLFN